MTFAPLLGTGPGIQLHAFAAICALVVGAIQLAMPKGTPLHRVVGSIWVLLMLVVCISAFFIHQLRIWGPWSPIHVLAIFTLATLPVAVWRAHKHAVEQHRRAMLGLFFGALIVAGLFTLLPGRVMHAAVFGVLPQTIGIEAVAYASIADPPPQHALNVALNCAQPALARSSTLEAGRAKPSTQLATNGDWRRRSNLPNAKAERGS
jgi:uncharacterized membrane protein